MLPVHLVYPIIYTIPALIALAYLSLCIRGGRR